MLYNVRAINLREPPKMRPDPSFVAFGQIEKPIDRRIEYQPGRAAKRAARTLGVDPDIKNALDRG